MDASATTSVVSAAWAAYGALTNQPAVVLASGSSAVIFALIAVGALRLGRSPRELRAAPLWLAVLSVAGVLLGVKSLAMLLSVSVVIANGPQVLVALRERDLSGVSVGTWLLSILEAVAWGTYGFFAHDGAILLYGLLHFITSVTILALRVAKNGWRSPMRL